MELLEAIEKTKGLYTIQEAAWYAKLPANTLRYWFKKSDDVNPVIDDDGKVNDSFITFVDFIQTLAVREIRREKKVPLQRIRKAIKHAEEVYNVKYPFARRHTTYLAGKDIYIQLEGMKDIIQVSGKNFDQVTSKKIIEYYLKEVYFDPATGLASIYNPAQNIQMNPKVGFGQPLVETCRIPAVVLWEAVKREGSTRKVANLYGINVKEVNDAVLYCDSLSTAA